MGLYKVMTTMKDRIQKVKETGKEASMTHSKFEKTKNSKKQWDNVKVRIINIYSHPNNNNNNNNNVFSL